MTAEFTAAFEAVIEQALDDSEREGELRTLHRLSLRRLQNPNAEHHHNHAAHKKEEQRLWLLVQTLNARIAARRWDIVIVNPEDMDKEIDRLERLVAAMEKAP